MLTRVGSSKKKLHQAVQPSESENQVFLLVLIKVIGYEIWMKRFFN
jgi:hypothetical protein